MIYLVCLSLFFNAICLLWLFSHTKHLNAAYYAIKLLGESLQEGGKLYQALIDSITEICKSQDSHEKAIQEIVKFETQFVQDYELFKSAVSDAMVFVAAELGQDIGDQGFDPFLKEEKPKKIN